MPVLLLIQISNARAVPVWLVLPDLPVQHLSDLQLAVTRVSFALFQGPGSVPFTWHAARRPSCYDDDLRALAIGIHAIGYHSIHVVQTQYHYNQTTPPTILTIRPPFFQENNPRRFPVRAPLTDRHQPNKYIQSNPLPSDKQIFKRKKTSLPPHPALFAQNKSVLLPVALTN